MRYFRDDERTLDAGDGVRALEFGDDERTLDVGDGVRALEFGDDEGDLGDEVRAVRVKKSGGVRKMRAALTPEADEGQLISLATDLVRKRLMEGTATSQETTHFLKLATREAQLKNDILERQKELLVAKTDAIRTAAKIEELYSEAINALRRYGGHASNGEESDEP